MRNGYEEEEMATTSFSQEFFAVEELANDHGKVNKSVERTTISACVIVEGKALWNSMAYDPLLLHHK